MPAARLSDPGVRLGFDKAEITARGTEARQIGIPQFDTAIQGAFANRRLCVANACWIEASVDTDHAERAAVRYDRPEAR